MYLRSHLKLGLALLVVLLAGCTNEVAFEPVKSVDPLIGTAPSTTPSAQRHSEADNEPKGQTFPAVGHPYGLTQWTPQTRDTEEKCISPYYYTDQKINGFRGSRWMSGSCTQDYGSVTFMPLSGTLRIAPEERGTSFQRDSEQASPDQYSVFLDEEAIQVDLTATRRSGFMRFRFDKAGEGFVVVQPNSDEGVGYVEIDQDNQEVRGYNPAHRIYQGWGESAGFSGYFVARFDRSFKTAGVWESYVAKPDQYVIKGNRSSVGAYLVFDVTSGDVVQVRVGTSLTSLEAARNNLEAEIGEETFERIAGRAANQWNQSLSAIKVSGASPSKTTQFYSALYHAMLLPRTMDDINGTYPGFASDSSVHTSVGFDYYGDFSVWDTYRAVQPLLTLIDPDRAASMVQSLVVKAEQGGWLPIFPSWNSYTAAMIGDHAISIIADAYTKGIQDFDAETAYTYMVQNATVTPSYDDYLDGKGRRALDVYLEYGYLPLEEPVEEAFHKAEQVSRTLEYAYDDFALGVFASALGKNNEAASYLQRALNYKHVIDPETGFARGRYADGSWVTPFNPSERTYEFITEGSPWHYSWYVPHDVAGLIELMGGREAFVDRLDTLFDSGEYWHGNEPSHQIAYLYAYAGAPWKTQQRITDILRDEYSDGPGGLSGNDDAGQMSAWYVFSALGFYPVAPGIPMYVIGTPGFPEAEIRVGPDRTFIIRANDLSDQNIYIQSATLNGAPLDRAWIRHSEFVEGGELIFEMGPSPNTFWGNKPENAPPSQTQNLEFVLPGVVSALQ